MAYFTLLGTSSLATLTSTIINAPINRIAADLEVSDREIVLAVSTFTVVMVLFAPLAGWLSQRYGAKRYLVASLVVMVIGQYGAAAADSLTWLVLMRAVQGLACSAIPPAIQQTFNAFWQDRRPQALAAWASAIGLGQALGPPLGGGITAVAGWRAVFVVQGTLTLIALFLAARNVPAPRAVPVRMHATGMTLLVAGVGLLVTAATLLGQRVSFGLELGLVGAGLILVAAFLIVSRNNPRALVPPHLLIEPLFLQTTLTAGTSMAAMGISAVTVPLYLGGTLGMEPGRIGLIAFAMAAAMFTFAPVTSRLADRFTARRVMLVGLSVLMVGPVVLALFSLDTLTEIGIVGIILGLAIIGSGVAATQSTAAMGVLRSPAAEYGAALGIHNMVRFSGLAVGYAWVSIAYPGGNVLFVHAGTVVLAGLALLAAAVAGPDAWGASTVDHQP
ncbi:MFS transporter [Ornithinimicrobium panacihumi]|uniref:MFS transporter n=1 Tax=Ornithinimicrobium panacihumi TaxID=2008449 RepID=UPI003F8AC491